MSSPNPTPLAETLAAPLSVGTGSPAGLDTAVPPSESPAPVESVPGYEILGELGRGGMGVVYKARQIKANRITALKMILAGAHASEDDLKRFQIEAEAVARLQHPNIVQVYEVGEHEGRPFFSLEFCSGGSLAQMLSGTPLPPRDAAALVAKLADAMHSAHSVGIIHRDLKPANVLLQEKEISRKVAKAQRGSTEENQVQNTSGSAPSSLPLGDFAPLREISSCTPKITDFGLAKKLDEPGMTQSGAVVGTPSYMSPEQASGSSNAMGPATDVYALGAILYESITGRPPFRAASVMDTLMQVIADEPVPAGRLNPAAVGDLETICHKCLRKEPEKRYASARELADDLDRWLQGRPIAARPAGAMERAWRWCRRNRAVASLLTTVACLLVVGTTVSVALAVKAQNEAEQAKRNEETAVANKERAEKAERDAEQKAAAEAAGRRRTERLAYADKLSIAQFFRQEGRIQEARDALDACRWDLRGWEHDHLDSQFNVRGRAVLVGHEDRVTAVGFSPDGSLVASSSVDDSLRIWDARTGRMLHLLRDKFTLDVGASFSPDGRRLAASYRDNTVKLWDVATKKIVLVLKGHVGEIPCLAFSRDGTRIVTGSKDKTIKVWDSGTGAELRTIKGHTFDVLSIAFSPDGSQIVSGMLDRTVRTWDSATGKPGLNIEGHRGGVKGVCFSPDGRRIASAGTDQAVKLWDARTGKDILTLSGQSSIAHGVAFSPDGLRIMCPSQDGTIRIWDATGKLLTSLKGHAGFVECAAFSADGRRIVSGGMDKRVMIWDAHGGDEPMTLRAHREGVEAVCVSPDGALIASGSLDKTVKLWNARTGEDLHTFQGHEGWVQCVGFSPDGTRLASGSKDGTVRVWDVAGGDSIRILKGHEEGVTAVCFSPDGTRIVSAAHDETLRVWDATKGRETLLFKGHEGYLHAACFTPDGRRVVSGGARTVMMWDPETGEVLRTLAGHTSIVSAACGSSDGKRIASGSYDKTVRVWDAETGKSLHVLRGHTGNVYGTAFSPDGTRVVSVGEDQAVKLWDLETEKEVLTLRGHTGKVRGVCFSPDGRRIITAGGDRTVRVWEAPGRSSVFTLSGYGGHIESVCISPDGSRIAVGGSTYGIKTWDAKTGQEAGMLTAPALNFTKSVCFSADGRRLISGGNDNAVRVWDVAEARELLILKGHSEAVVSVCISPDGERIASGSEDKTVKVWDARTGSIVHEFKPHRGKIQSVCFSPDGTRLAVGSGDFVGSDRGEIKMHDASDGRELWAIEAHESAVQSVCFSPDGTRLASGSFDATVKLWDVSTGKETLTLSKHAAQVTSVAFSPDGKRIVSAGGDNVLRIWDAQTGRQTLVLEGHGANVTSVCFSADGKRIISGGGDRMVKVWDALPGTELHVLAGHDADVRDIRFSLDGRRIVTRDESGRTIVWDTKANRLNEAAPAAMTDRQATLDGRLHALAEGKLVRIFDHGASHPLAVRAAWLDDMARPDAAHHREQTSNSARVRDWFATAFHAERLSRLQPWDESALLLHAHALLADGRDAEAALPFVRAAFLSPHGSLWSPLVDHALFADAASQKADWPAALRGYRLAVRRPKASVSDQEKLFHAHLAVGDRASAAAVWRESDKWTLWRRAYLGRVVATNEDDVRRLVVVGEQLVKQQKSVGNQAVLGSALYRAGRYEESVKMLDKGYAEAHAFRSMALKRLGRDAEARTAFEAFEKWRIETRFLSWQDRIFAQVLSEEAGRLLSEMPRAGDE